MTGNTSAGDRRFWEVAQERYARVAGFGKPVVAAELGFSGSQAYVEAWAEDMKCGDPRLPLLKSVVYFNDIDPHAWPAPFGHPDWRISADLLKRGCERKVAGVAPVVVKASAPARDPAATMVAAGMSAAETKDLPVARVIMPAKAAASAPMSARELTQLYKGKSWLGTTVLAISPPTIALSHGRFTGRPLPMGSAAGALASPARCASRPPGIRQLARAGHRRASAIARRGNDRHRRRTRPASGMCSGNPPETTESFVPGRHRSVNVADSRPRWTARTEPRAACCCEANEPTLIFESVRAFQLGRCGRAGYFRDCGPKHDGRLLVAAAWCPLWGRIEQLFRPAPRELDEKGRIHAPVRRSVAAPPGERLLHIEVV